MIILWRYRNLTASFNEAILITSSTATPDTHCSQLKIYSFLFFKSFKIYDIINISQKLSHIYLVECGIQTSLGKIETHTKIQALDRYVMLVQAGWRFSVFAKIDIPVDPRSAYDALVDSRLSVSAPRTSRPYTSRLWVSRALLKRPHTNKSHVSRNSVS